MNKKIKMKSDILSSAVELFEIHGYKDTTTRMIAEKSNVGRGHLSYYFPKKDDILKELVLMSLKKMELFLDDKAMKSKIQLPVYFGLSLRCYEYFCENSDYVNKLYRDNVTMSPLHKHTCGIVYDILAKRNHDMYDEASLKQGIEFSMLIFGLLIHKKLGEDLSLHTYVATTKHFLFELGMTTDQIEEVIYEIDKNFDEVNKDELMTHMNGFQYNEIYLANN